MGCVCCCPLTEEEERERRPILAEVSHTASEALSIHSSPLGKDAKWTELAGTPLDPRTTMTLEHEQIMRNFCERVIPHDQNYVNFDVIDDRINRKEHFANEYFGNIRIQPVRRHSIRHSVPEISLEQSNELEDLTTDLIDQIKSEIVEFGGDIAF